MPITSITIYPAIGVARLGNSPDEFFIGPERVWHPLDPAPGNLFAGVVALDSERTRLDDAALERAAASQNRRIAALRRQHAQDDQADRNTIGADLASVNADALRTTQFPNPPQHELNHVRGTADAM